MRGRNETLTRRSLLAAMATLAVCRPAAGQSSFAGQRAGDRRMVDGVELCWCPAGTFVMGSPPEEPGREPIETPHEVRISTPFYMARHEVTQAQWHRVTGTRPSW